MSKVFLIQAPTLNRRTGATPDVRGLTKFGELRVLVDSSESAEFESELIISRIKTRLKGYEDGDYIAHAGGSALAVFVVGMILRSMGFTEFQWLRYERGTVDGRRTHEGSHYLPIQVSTLSLADVRFSAA